MILSPYDTTACRAYNTRDIVKAIRLAHVDDETEHVLETPSGRMTMAGLVGITPNSQNVPVFSHPLVAKLRDDNDDYSHVFLDLRGLARVQRDGGLKITNATEYELLLIRGLLTSHWVKHGPHDLSTLGDIAPQIYTRWLSQGITRRLGLSPQEQVKVTVVAAFYWYSHFMEGMENGDAISESDKRRIVTKLNSITQIPSSLSFEIADTMTYMGDMASFVETLQRVVDSPRLERMGVGLLISMLGGSWFGMNAREVTAVAIEYPPTFLAIIYVALKDRGYRKSVLGSMAYEYDKRDRGREFQRNVNHLLEGMLES